MKMLAYQLKQIDKDYDLHRQAWIGRLSEGIKKNQTFDKFYDYEKVIDEFWNGKKVSVEEKLMKLMTIANGTGWK